SPASRLFWNEFYVDVERTPEFQRSSAAQQRVASAEFQKETLRLRSESLVDYGRQMALKRSVLEELAKLFFNTPSERRRAFEQYASNHAELESYARFRATVERQGTSWRQWPSRQREGKLLPGDYAESAKSYHLYVQWLCREQLQTF